jgi:predicted MFS family arabinose efflux permease
VLAPAFFVIGVGIGLGFATIPTVALGDAKPDEAGSASGSFSSIQQLASAIGSAAVTSIFFQAGASGLGHAMKVTLIVVLALTAFSLPVVALMPRKAPAGPRQ